MDGDQELLRLAELLRLSADVAKSIGQTRQNESRELNEIADLIRDTATRIELVVTRAGAPLPEPSDADPL